MTTPDTGRFGVATPGRVAPPPAPREEPPVPAGPVRGPRRLRWAAVGAGVVAVGVGCWFWGHETVAPTPPAPLPPAVLETAVALPAGTPVTPTDLRSVRVVGNRSGLLAARAERSLRGMVARTYLPAGTLVRRSSLAAASTVPPKGLVLVGLALKPGQLPQGGVAVGDRVEVVVVPSSTTSGLPPQPLATVVAPVWAVAAQQSDTAVTVAVPEKSAPSLAGAAAAGDVTIIELGGSSTP